MPEGLRITIDARYVTDHFPGIGRYVYNLLRGLAELDTPHRFLVLHNPNQPNSRHDLKALAQHPQFKLCAVEAAPFSLAEQYRIPRLLRELRAERYHAPYYVRPYFGIACPIIVTLYDAIPRLFPQEVSLKARLMFDLLTRLALRNATRILTISHSASADLRAAYGIPAERISVTPLAADVRFRPQEPQHIAAVRQRYGLPERYLITLCSNKPHKNLPTLIAAYGMSRARYSHALVVAGHWDERYPAARELSAQLGLTQQVRFLHNAAENDLPALLSGASAFVYPSLYEGFGLPPLEALACGTPVICGSTSSLPEVVGDAAVQIDMRQPEALASTIDNLLNDTALQERLRRIGTARAAQFTWRRTAEQTVAAYQSGI